MKRVVQVALGARSYPVTIAAGLLDDADAIRACVGGHHVLIVSNEVVAPLALERVRSALAGLAVSSLVLPDGEVHKSLVSADRLFTALAKSGASRDATVIALGGGVVGDLAGFAAALWMRGVALVQIPTTLLAMVDSSVGGKTAVNLSQGKNLVGAFHQPRAVLIDPLVLATLPKRELRAGLAEVVKYGAIGDGAFFGWLEHHAEALLMLRPDSTAEAIERSVRHKAGVVARDEREDGERALLNFGHTFGHAIEALGAYRGLNHGEAVAVGMILAAELSARIGMATSTDFNRLNDLLARLGLPTRIPPGQAASQLLDAMRLDKKALSGELRLVLWRGIGQAELVASVPEATILETLRAGGASG
ncbi:MAG: 3-dehydroquinate synthase [Xanthomonadales bacterium]|nr:3-dehydroquinate synthase [Xanthomonadales bacterium]